MLVSPLNIRSPTPYTTLVSAISNGHLNCSHQCFSLHLIDKGPEKRMIIRARAGRAGPSRKQRGSNPEATRQLQPQCGAGSNRAECGVLLFTITDHDEARILVRGRKFIRRGRKKEPSWLHLESARFPNVAPPLILISLTYTSDSIGETLARYTTTIQTPEHHVATSESL